jgi:MSHA biogenesis protein MshN
MRERGYLDPLVVSLINKMLQDLEARQETSAASTPVYKGLRPVGTDAPHGSRRLLLVLLGVLGVGVAIYFAAEHMGVALLPASVVAMISPKATAATNVAPAPTISAPVAATPAPTPVVGQEVKKMTPQRVEPTPPPVATNAIAAADAEPKPAAAPTAQRHNIESQKNSQMRIVKAAEPPVVRVSKAERTQPAKTPSTTKKAGVTAAAPAQQVVVVDKKIRPLTAEEKSEAAYRRAVRLLDQGRPEDASVQLRESLREQPDHVKARELAAGLALQGGHWREAQELLEEGLRQVPSHYPFARLLARVYVDHGSEAKALAVMESAAPAGSDDPDFSALLGVLYQRAGRHADAVQVYKRALALRPQNARTWLGFAISLEGTEQWDAAKRAYARAKESGGLTPPLIQYAEQRLAALSEKTQH